MISGLTNDNLSLSLSLFPLSTHTQPGRVVTLIEAAEVGALHVYTSSLVDVLHEV